MTNAHAILEARWAVLHALVDKMRAENGEELTRFKEQLDKRCSEYNALTGAGTQTIHGDPQ